MRQIENLSAQDRFDRIRVRIEEEHQGSKEYKLLLDAGFEAFFQAGIDNVYQTPKEVVAEGLSEGWEFRSYMKLDDELLFSLHQAADEISFWAGLGASQHGIIIQRFDSENNSLIIQEGDSIHNLPLQTARIPAQVDQSDQTGVWKAELRRVWPDFKEKWEQATADSPEMGKMMRDYQAVRKEAEERLQDRGSLLRAIPTVSERIRVAHQDLAEIRELETERDRIFQRLLKSVMQHPSFVGADRGKIIHLLAHGPPTERE